MPGSASPLVAVHPLSVRGSTELFVHAPDRDGLFARITAMLDRLRFSVLEARILSSPSAMALDTFLLLDADTQQPATVARAQELAARVRHALTQAAGVQPSQRGMSRHQKYFQVMPRIDFRAAGNRTQMALVATDRPGLLAAVAQVMLHTEVRVHDARIATFGERVEDFFQLTDRNNQLLSAAHQQCLLDALLQRLGPARD